MLTDVRQRGDAVTAEGSADRAAASRELPDGLLDALQSLDVRPPTPATVIDVLDHLDLLPTTLFRAAAEPARRAERVARELGRDDLAIRARLVLSVVLVRDGHLAEAGRLAHDCHAQARRHADPQLLARSHRALSVFHRQIGDLAEALEHAVQSIRYLPDVSPRLRARYLLTLAIQLDDTGSGDEAHRRLHEALEISDATGDVEMTMYVLNVLAYSAYERADQEAACSHVERMLRLADGTGVPLTAQLVDTIARVDLLCGRLEQAEKTLSSVLTLPDDAMTDLLTDATGLANCLVTAAEVQRRKGAAEEAQRILDTAKRLCEARGLHGAGAQVRLLQAELYAETGRFREAYEEHRAFHAASVRLRSEQQEARANALQAVLEAEEARRTSDRFRELAHRDPLTGLHNRRHVDARLPALLTEAALRRTPVSAALVDLDLFKRINDTLSHDTGDRVLRQIAELLTAATPAPNLIARVGGEEFLLVWLDGDHDEAVCRCETLRRTIRRHPWGALTGALPVTASIGVTTMATRQASTLLGNADRNLYRAKRAGRDRVAGDT